MRLIDADALHEDMLYEMCGTGYQTLALSVIRRAPTITPPPNAPLTLEELLKMDGEPVWVELINIDRPNAWFLLNLRDDEAVNKRGGFVSLIDYGNTWLAYRRKTAK